MVDFIKMYLIFLAYLLMLLAATKCVLSASFNTCCTMFKSVLQI